MLEATALTRPPGPPGPPQPWPPRPWNPNFGSARRVIDAGQDPVRLAAGQPLGIDRFLDLLLRGCLHRGPHVVTALAELLRERIGELVALFSIWARVGALPPARALRRGEVLRGPPRARRAAWPPTRRARRRASRDARPAGRSRAAVSRPAASLCVLLPLPPSRLLPDVAAPDTDTTMPSTSTDIAAIHFHPGLIEAPSRLLPGDLLTGSRGSFGPVLVGSL